MWGWILTGVLVAFAVYGLRRLLLWMAARGWVYYGERPSGTTSRAVSGVDVLFRPEVENYIEMRDAEEIIADSDESGEPPTLEVG